MSGAYSRERPDASEEAASANHHVSPCVTGLHPLGRASAQPFALSNRNKGLIRSGDILKGVTDATTVGENFPATLSNLPREE